MTNIWPHKNDCVQQIPMAETYRILPMHTVALITCTENGLTLNL